MDVFQIRLDFLALLKRLNASQQSMQKTLAFADRNVKASGDIWDCILAEASKTNLSSRLNILFTLDYLFTDYSAQFSRTLVDAFLSLAARDLATLIDHVVPHRDTTAVKLNSAVTMSILHAWRVKRFFDTTHLNKLIAVIEERRQQAGKDTNQDASTTTTLTRDEIVRRIEEDRERHKRIREKIWVFPPKSYLDAVPDWASSSTSSSSKRVAQGVTATLPPSKRPRLDNNTLTPPSPSDAATNAMPPPASPSASTRPDPLDIQFEDLWETTSDLNDDDLEAWAEEADERWWGGEKVHQRQQKMQEQRRELEQSRQRGSRAQSDQRPGPPPPPPPQPPATTSDVSERTRPPPSQQQQSTAQQLRPPPPPPPQPPSIPTGPSSSSSSSSAPGWRERNGYRPQQQPPPPPRRPRAGGRW